MWLSVYRPGDTAKAMRPILNFCCRTLAPSQCQVHAFGLELHPLRLVSSLDSLAIRSPVLPVYLQKQCSNPRPAAGFNWVRSRLITTSSVWPNSSLPTDFVLSTICSSHSNLGPEKVANLCDQARYSPNPTPFWCHTHIWSASCVVVYSSTCRRAEHSFDFGPRPSCAALVLVDQCRLDFLKFAFLDLFQNKSSPRLVRESPSAWAGSHTALGVQIRYRLSFMAPSPAPRLYRLRASNRDRKWNDQTAHQAAITYLLMYQVLISQRNSIPGPQVQVSHALLLWVRLLYLFTYQIPLVFPLLSSRGRDFWAIAWKEFQRRQGYGTSTNSLVAVVPRKKEREGGEE